MKSPFNLNEPAKNSESLLRKILDENTCFSTLDINMIN